MNVAIILSSGAGHRFASEMPKQYHKINGKMVLSYVVEASHGAKSIDKILIVAHPDYSGLIREQYPYADFTEGGEQRNNSLGNALRYIEKNYKDCFGVIVFDAVRPFVTSELVDIYMEKLLSCDAVATTVAITDSLGCYDMHRVDRSRYYLLQSPEAFRFDLLIKNFDENSPLTEVTQHLPSESRVHKYWDFKNNLKVTYPHDLAYIEAIISHKVKEEA